MIEEFLKFNDLVRLYHWSTKKYERHVAAGTLYTSMQDLTDKFAEAYLKNKNKITLNHSKIDLYKPTDKEIVVILETFVKYLTNLKKKVKSGDLQNIIDEMLAEINKTLYLFTLQ